MLDLVSPPVSRTTRGTSASPLARVVKRFGPPAHCPAVSPQPEAAPGCPDTRATPIRRQHKTRGVRQERPVPGRRTGFLETAATRCGMRVAPTPAPATTSLPGHGRREQGGVASEGRRRRKADTSLACGAVPAVRRRDWSSDSGKAEQGPPFGLRADHEIHHALLAHVDAAAARPTAGPPGSGPDRPGVRVVRGCLTEARWPADPAVQSGSECGVTPVGADRPRRARPTVVDAAVHITRLTSEVGAAAAAVASTA